MKLAIVKNSVVVNVIEVADDWNGDDEAAWKPESGTPVVAAAAAIGDSYVNGEFMGAVVEPLSPQQIEKAIINQVQAKLDSFAREREYDDMDSLVSYVGDPDPIFSAEGARGKLLRSQTWATMKQIRADVLAGARVMPSGFADIEAELPALTW